MATSGDQAVTYFTMPGLELLGPPPLYAAADRTLLQRRASDLEDMLKRCGAAARVAQIRLGPVFTSFMLELTPGVRLRQIVSLAEDIALALRCSAVEVTSRPGDAHVAVQAPNDTPQPVVISELIAADTFAGLDGTLPVAIGKDVLGDPVSVDLAELQHLLIAGQTGTGKTGAVHAILQSILFRFGTARLWLQIYGAKLTDYANYRDIPHLLEPIGSQGDRLQASLHWLRAQLDYRYKLLVSASARTLDSYNARVQDCIDQRTPLTWQAEPGNWVDLPTLARIVMIIDAVDELVDGEIWSDDLLEIVRRGAQVGLHLVIVTRSLSPRMLEELLRQGSIGRLCLRTSSARESEALLDMDGAERLRWTGDAYLKPPAGPAMRVHLPLIVEEELRAVGDHWRAQGEPILFAVAEDTASAPLSTETSDDDMYQRALGIVLGQKSASTSYVQRQLRIGYNSAARLIERMEREGHVGAPDHVGRRTILSRPAAPKTHGEPDMQPPTKSRWPWKR